MVPSAQSTTRSKCKQRESRVYDGHTPEIGTLEKVTDEGGAVTILGRASSTGCAEEEYADRIGHGFCGIDEDVFAGHKGVQRADQTRTGAEQRWWHMERRVHVTDAAGTRE